MPTKTQTFAQLAEDTATRLTSSLAKWTGFLSTVGRLYKYPYHEQLMIYAQRPDATACADYELWNDKMNRFVSRGSMGIALLDATGDRPKLKYVFDVSDAGAAILEACKEVKNSDPVEIGSYKGFAMYLSYAAFGNEHTLTLEGAMSHTAKLGFDAMGNITRIDNALNGM